MSGTLKSRFLTPFFQPSGTDSQTNSKVAAPAWAFLLVGIDSLQLARIVAFAHRLKPPVVHRDLKPANVLVERLKSGHFKLWVTDFGIGDVVAGQAIQSRLGTSRGQLVALELRGAYSPLYASPQQMRAEKPDPRDDVHALGVIWYQLLTGDLGAGAPSGLQWQTDLKRRGVPEQQTLLLGACLEARPEHRPRDAAVLAETLARLTRPDAVPAEVVRVAVPVAPPPTDGKARAPVPVKVVHAHPVGKPVSPAPAKNSESSWLRQVALQDGLTQLLRHPRRAGGLVWCSAMLLGLMIGFGGFMGIVTLIWEFSNRSEIGRTFAWVCGLGTAFLILALTIWLVRKLSAWRARGYERLLEQIAREYPEEIRHYGGLAMLRNPVTLRALLGILIPGQPEVKARSTNRWHQVKGCLEFLLLTAGASAFVLYKMLR